MESKNKKKTLSVTEGIWHLSVILSEGERATSYLTRHSERSEESRVNN